MLSSTPLANMMTSPLPGLSARRPQIISARITSQFTDVYMRDNGRNNRLTLPRWR
jgi:hypothetical protein